MSEPLLVATLITRLEGGAGVLALRGALALDRGEFQTVLITGPVTGGGHRLLDQARAAGLEVIVEPALRAPIDPRRDAVAARSLAALLRRRRFDVVHTHTAKAGAVGRIAARRAGAPRVIHTYHGFPFHEFQSRLRRAAYIAVERRLGRLTDLALCVGTGVAVEAIRRGLVPPERIRTIGVAVTDRPSPAPGARIAARRALGLPADADVFVLPSRYEGLPTAIVEAMACGIPVVATAVNAVGDVVVPGETGLLVPPQRPELLAEAINYLLDAPDAAARMAATARERLGDRFSVAALREALVAAYTGQQ